MSAALLHGLSHDGLAACIDQTFLRPQAGPREAQKWIEENISYDFASLCVSPCFVPLATSICKESITHVCSVVGFPHGNVSTACKCFEAVQLAKAGCDELDIVMNIGAFLEGDEFFVAKEIVDIMLCVAKTGYTDIIYKVILETSYLTPDQIASATRLISRTGVRFVKTSTGFADRGASLEDVKIMVENASEGVGVKASGGIRDVDMALAMLLAGATRLGTSCGDKILAQFDERLENE